MPVKINWPVVGSTVLPNVGGVAAAVITRNALTPWYRELKKPRWTPSNCTFGVTWGALYSCIGYASYLVYRDGGGFDGAAKIPLIVYGSNILLNWAWTPCFFGLKRTELALYEIQLVNATALATGYLFFKISPLAGYLIVPYSLWLGLATVLNYVIWRDNRKDSARIKEIKEI